MELTSDNFDDIVAKNKYVVVKFYTKWCHYCKLLAPEYEKLYEVYQTKRKDVLIGRIEGGANNAIIARYGIYSFPIVALFFPNEKKIMDVFRENRIAEVMDNWIERSAPKIDLNEEIVIEMNNTNNNEKGNDTNSSDLVTNITSQLNDQEITKESEYVKQEFLALKRKICDLENEVKKLKDSNTLKDTAKSNYYFGKSDKWLIFFEISTINIGLLCGILMIIIAIFAMVNKIYYKNKGIKGE